MKYLLEFVVSVLSSIGFGLVFSIPKKTLLVSGINGGICWIIYKFILNNLGNIYLANFISSMIIAILSEILARKLRFPASVFIFPGIINLCPGEAIYNTMKFFINNETVNAITSFYKAVAIAGSIAFGVLLASSFSKSLKSYRTRSTKRTNYLRRRKKHD
ncbi:MULTISPECIES: threonine/serine exporter family protein [Anaerococcus]|uniref:Threonine/serine exporter n=1 Tax=Anaerococcus nagyae TaxID=1755241 RepID=A0A3E2TGD4_9FIRM|nr:MULTISPECIES: threonine/serine exporter family protein [Anaerococcus]MDU1828890.1 threonine/serine exporter family protein [Anaerococcus sp.]MDU1864804.1 threonine/serine exporter family protein [Anaerococcus sp.]MDU2565842.1 threonine/serine exporter family protein [Anaerococcus sp.]MDU3211719.1 threonine/serine exporter family protein [Anaerococcus sp.]RGB75148.1 threonine/serine exporter [Anaerococcus nagyae]